MKQKNIYNLYFHADNFEYFCSNVIDKVVFVVIFFTTFERYGASTLNFFGLWKKQNEENLLLGTKFHTPDLQSCMTSLILFDHGN